MFAITVAEDEYICETKRLTGSPPSARLIVHRIGPPRAHIGDIHWVLGRGFFKVDPLAPAPSDDAVLEAIRRKLGDSFAPLTVDPCGTCGAPVHFPTCDGATLRTSFCARGHENLPPGRR